MGSPRGLVGVAAAMLLVASSAWASSVHSASARGGQSVQAVWVRGAGTVWVWTQDATGPGGGGGRQGIVRTTDGGASWSQVTPPGLSVQGGRHWISGLFALNASEAWVTYGSVSWNGAQEILRTADGGRHWTIVGRKPGGRACQLQFVSAAVGWCTFIGAAAGSETVALYKTGDGGRRWQLVSKTPIGGSHRPGTLPFGGDKSIVFTSTHRGWALFYSPVGTAQLFQSRNGGSTWTALHVAPAPATRLGGGFAGSPVLDGSDGAVAYSDGGQKGPNTIVYVTTDGGLRWHPVVPPGPAEPWSVAMPTAQRWRLLYANRILETDDAGRSWQRVTSTRRFPPLFPANGGVTSAVTFVNGRIGWVAQQSETTGSYTLWRTADGGRDWNQVNVPGA